MTKKNETGTENTLFNEAGQNRSFVASEYMGQLAMQKPSLLLHSCCGPCSSAVIEALASEYAITVFFYNPNITDQQEYEKRLLSQVQFIKAFNESLEHENTVELLKGDYETDLFYEETKGLEMEPEGGQRCQQCFRLRLEKTAGVAKLGGFDCFATTLAVSPKKPYEIISKIGWDLCARYGIEFLDKDFKKGGGYQRSVMLSKQYLLYRQTYCGCEYARR